MRQGTSIENYAVPFEKLRWVCPEEIFTFECTNDIEPLKEFIGQARAIDSIKFGLAVERLGYNLFLTGLTGTGKAATIKAHLERFIDGKQEKGMRYELYDWCYVYNFSDPDQPRILKMPQGMAKIFSSNLDALLRKLKEEIPKTFGSEEYNKRKQDVMQHHQKRYQEAIDALEQEAARNNLMVQLSPMGAAVVPLVDGKPLPREEFLAMPDAEREPIETRRLEIMRKVEETYSRIRDLEKEIGEKMKEIEQKAGEFAVANPFEEMFSQYREYPDVLEFLTQAKEYTLSRLELFLQPQTQAQVSGILPASQTDAFTAYKVNIFVDNSSLSGPPITIEPNPNWFNIFGKIERRALMGTYVSDHTMIKSGAVQKANGGYLILGIRDVLLNQGVWEGLGKILRRPQGKKFTGLTLSLSG